MTGLTILLANGGTITAVVIAGLLAFNDKPGWGWFLGVGVLLTVSLTYRGDKSEETKIK